MKVECEMSLDEWCQKLHSSHLVNTELAALRAENAALRVKHEVACDTIERQRADIDTIRGYLEAMKNSCEHNAISAQRRIKQLREALDSTTKYLPHFSTELQQITTLLTTADNTDEIDALLKELEEYRQRNIDVCIENSLR